MPIKRRYNTTSANWGMDQLVGMVTRGDLNLNPSYQRGDVWSEEQRIKLIDSVMMGIGCPAIFIREVDPGQRTWLEAVDGKQRITTFAKFMAGEFAWEGERYPDWDIVSQRRWNNFTVAIYKVHDITDAETIELYERLNFCGVPHERSPLQQFVETLVDPECSRLECIRIQSQHKSCLHQEAAKLLGRT